MKHISECIKKNMEEIRKKKKPKKIILNENKKGPGIENMPFTIIIH